MSITTIPTRRRRALAFSLAADALNSMFAQLVLGGAFFVLFMSEMGLSKGQIGFISSLLPFAGILALVSGPAAARWGYRRVFLIAWGLRKIVMATLVLAPLVLATWGLPATFAYVSVVFALFSIGRAFAETALNPWTLEYIPDSIRGKYQAVSNILATLSAGVAVAIGSYVIGRVAGLARFQIIVSVGMLCAALAWVMASRLPGGAPVHQSGGRPPSWRQVLAVANDPDLRRYLAGFALYTFGYVPAASFLPLFMKDLVGLSEQQVVLLQNGALVGALLSGYVWGWLADRYGGKLVWLAGILLRCAAAIGWLLMPRYAPASLGIAFAIAIFDGVANSSLAIGSTRLLYISIVPRAQKTEYLALHYAFAGIVGGIAPLAAGMLLDQLKGLSGRLLFFQLDPFTPLFLSSLALYLAGMAVLSRIRAEGSVAGAARAAAGGLVRRLARSRR